MNDFGYPTIYVSKPHLTSAENIKIISCDCIFWTLWMLNNKDVMLEKTVGWDEGKIVFLWWKTGLWNICKLIQYMKNKPNK